MKLFTVENIYLVFYCDFSVGVNDKLRVCRYKDLKLTNNQLTGSPRLFSPNSRDQTHSYKLDGGGKIAGPTPFTSVSKLKTCQAGRFLLMLHVE